MTYDIRILENGISVSDDLPIEIQHKILSFNRVLMSYVDFQQAGQIAFHVLDMNLHNRHPHDRFILEGLNCGMIIAYCRPFSINDRGSKCATPEISRKILKILTLEERQIHDVVMEDRNTVLAHSDSSAWAPEAIIQRLGDRDLLSPRFSRNHEPLTREITEKFKVMCEKLREECFAERRRLEPEVKPYLRVLEMDKEKIERIMQEAEMPLSGPSKPKPS